MPVLPLETQTLYAELVDQLGAMEARRSIGDAPGCFVEKKEFKGARYVYFQYSGPGGAARQVYVGRKSSTTDRVVARFEHERRERVPDEQRIARLTAQLRAGGALMTDGPSARVVRALADTGVFRLGGVLVGTHAFTVLGNVLGRRWSTGLSTHDVDIARRPEADIDVAVPELNADIPKTLDSLAMGFLPVPHLDHKRPPTSFEVRGRALRVDVLTPLQGRSDAPVRVKRFNVAAQPLRYLDYIIEEAIPAALIDGGAAIVRVPSPARFAFHKLMVATLRPVAMQTKAAKDVAQAAEVLDALVEDRPGDVDLAWQAIKRRGAPWEGKARSGLRLLERRSHRIHERVVAII